MEGGTRQRWMKIAGSVAALALLAWLSADMILSRAGGRESDVPKEGYLLSDFRMETLEGGTVSRADLLGKPIYLNFWASWCGPCRAEMPDINEIHREMGDRVNILTVNLSEPEPVISAFLEQNDLQLPVARDQTYLNPTLEAEDPAAVKPGSLYGQWGFSYIPVSIFADERGAVCGVFTWGMSKPEILEMIVKAERGC